MHKSPWTWGWLNFYLLLKSKVFLYSSWGSHSKYTVVVCQFLLQLTHWKSPWCWERLRTEGALGDEMVGWHHWCNGHELGQTLGDDEGQGGLQGIFPTQGSNLWLFHWHAGSSPLSHQGSPHLRLCCCSVIQSLRNWVSRAIQ